MSVLLIDGSNYMARGFHAVKGLSTADGFPTNAIKGFLSIVAADIKQLKPTHIVVAFDEKGKKNWRSVLYPEYKQSKARVAAREKIVREGNTLSPQYAPLLAILKAAGLCVCAIPGEEADDIIGTLAVDFSAQGEDVVIASSDKDFAQLVTKKIRLMNQRKFIGERGVREKFGVAPSMIVEYLGLVGDGVDNIPGVQNIGPKTAAKLLNEHGSLKAVVAHRESLSSSMCNNIESHRKKFKWTLPLLTIKTDMDLGVSLEDCTAGRFKKNRLKRLCLELELKQAYLELSASLREVYGDD